MSDLAGGAIVGLRLTSAGASVLTGSVLCLIAGSLLGYQELQMVAAAGLVGLMLALLWVLPVAQLKVERSIEPARVSRGEPALGLLHVRHEGRFRTSASTAADHVASEQVAVDVPSLRSGGAQSVTYRLPTSRRGHYLVGPLVLTRADPLRLLRRDVAAGQSEQLWVRPRVFPVSLAPLGRSRDLDGPASEQALEGSITFRALREYVAGDDLRRVHWRSTARTGTLMVRESVDPSRPEVALLLDDRAPSYDSPADLEEAVDLAASLAGALRVSGFPCRVRAVSGQPVGGGDQLADGSALLDGLAELASSNQADSALLEAAVAELSGGTAAVLVTGNAPEVELECLLALRRRYGFVLALCVARTPVPSVRGVQVLQAPDAESLALRWKREAGRR